jgi:hypothetical protein
LEACLNGTTQPKPVVIPARKVPVLVPEPTKAVVKAAQARPMAPSGAEVRPKGSALMSNVPSTLSDISGEQFDVLANAAMGKIVHGVGDVKVDKMIGTRDFY